MLKPRASGSDLIRLPFLPPAFRPPFGAFSPVERYLCQQTVLHQKGSLPSQQRRGRAFPRKGACLEFFREGVRSPPAL